MYRGKREIDINFVILSPDPNIGRLRGTVRSIKNNYKADADIVCSVRRDIKKPQLDEMNEVCDAFRGGETITSLINNGIKNSKSGWTMLIMEGALLPRSVQYRYSSWMEKNTDILFPIVMSYDREGIPTKIYNTFAECTLNGIMMDRDFFLKVGKLSENPLTISREFWSFDAADKGATFKAILGIKIC
jgi:hypothetical protein